MLVRNASPSMGRNTRRSPTRRPIIQPAASHRAKEDRDAAALWSRSTATRTRRRLELIRQVLPHLAELDRADRRLPDAVLVGKPNLRLRAFADRAYVLLGQHGPAIVDADPSPVADHDPLALRIAHVLEM